MKQRAWNALLLASGVSTSAAFSCLAQLEGQKRNVKSAKQALPAQRVIATSVSAEASTGGPEQVATNDRRTFNTAADSYYARHRKLPLPRIMHATLSDLGSDSKDDTIPKSKRNVLVIGDVHGCLEELLLLHQKAVEENEHRDFDHVVLVGDLCNKGPASAEVIEHVRSQENWLAVRGNHDDGSLAAALGDAERQQKKKYRWTAELTDEDILFLAELPYTLRIPGEYLQEHVDTVIVHAGLVPDVSLEDQTVETMITVRQVRRNALTGAYSYHRPHSDECAKDLEDPVPWASVWRNEFRVIFGHDARRGYQRYDGDWAIGLDTGCCYGKQLTGIILPSKKIVKMDALKVHSPIASKVTN